MATPSKLIEPGETAPDFSVSDQSDTTRRLKDFRGQWVVLYFYPKDDTPGCTTEACQFRDRLPTFRKSSLAILGVSPDSPESHRKFIRKHQLNFDLLADVNQTVCHAYGVWQEKTNYGRTYMGVVRTTYLIDPKGKVAHRWDKVSVAGHDQQILERFEALAEE